MSRGTRSLASLVLASLLTSGCTTADSPFGASGVEVSLVSTEPASGSTGVDPGAPMVLRFSRPMMAGMDTLVLLHEQSASGPIVPAAPMWSANRMVLTVRPTVPLRSATSYVLHLVPGMMDAEGRMLSPATGSMMTGGSTAIGMMGSGSTMRRRTGGMMGAGWGPDGMTFSFTTG